MSLFSPDQFASRAIATWLLVAIVSFHFVMLPAATLAQDSSGSTTSTEGSTSLAGPLKIVKLLWKANPQNAANTLAKSIATAADRHDLPALRTALLSMQGEIKAVVAAADLNDPRYGVSLSASLLDSENRPAGQTIVTALEKLKNVGERQLLWQVWLQVDLEAALHHFDQTLLQPDDNANESAWRSAMIAAALRAERTRAGQSLIDNWQHLSSATQLAAIEPLTSTADSMQLLLRSVAAGSISKDLINTNQLRKWLASGNPQLVSAIEGVWGRVRQVDNAARAQLVASTLEQINRGARGSASRGATIFDRVCSQCHVLHGRGYEVGPNIAGNGRGNLQQLVSNILDPSLVIGEAFQAKTVLTVDGEVVSGLVAAENDRYLTLKVQGGKTIEFDKQDVEQIQASANSLMPEGVESQMQPQELLDLLAYLCLLAPLDAAENELIPGTPVDFVQP